MFISPAYAQAAGGGQGGFDIMALLPLILIFIVFYFLLIRPQQKRMKEHRQMVENLRRGDRVVTGGGIVGQVTKIVSDTEAQVEIAEGVRVRVVKSNVQQVLSKSQPAEGEQGGGGDKQAANDAGDTGKGVMSKLLGGGRGDDKSS
ncbi:protein translocase subunit yajC [Limimonas halophila]|uniref:Sec translocon accessory complex subunit YajC n=1 Tax=Limimonas halophila TaxID=1082479 RepID=A0A1G7NHP5_9PROT|nr:preprotein translocase subunit YajC [Limimonas halophila]SDF73486.1 protein translocase subunit yajC [Limimonas halophila]